MTINRDRHTAAAAKKRTNRGTAGKGERRLNRLLLQLIASAAIFLLVFVGGGLIPDQVFDVFGSVRQVISGDQPLLQSVEALGQAISEGESWSQAMREWCMETFLPGSGEQAEDTESPAQLSQATEYHRHLLPQVSDSAAEQLSPAVLPSP